MKLEMVEIFRPFIQVSVQWRHLSPGLNKIYLMVVHRKLEVDAMVAPSLSCLQENDLCGYCIC